MKGRDQFHRHQQTKKQEQRKEREREREKRAGRNSHRLWTPPLYAFRFTVLQTKQHSIHIAASLISHVLALKQSQVRFSIPNRFSLPYPTRRQLVATVKQTYTHMPGKPLSLVTARFCHSLPSSLSPTRIYAYKFVENSSLYYGMAVVLPPNRAAKHPSPTEPPNQRKTETTIKRQQQNRKPRKSRRACPPPLVHMDWFSHLAHQVQFKQPWQHHKM